MTAGGHRALDQLTRLAAGAGVMHDSGTVGMATRAKNIGTAQSHRSALPRMVNMGLVARQPGAGVDHRLVQAGVFVQGDLG